MLRGIGHGDRPDRGRRAARATPSRPSTSTPPRRTATALQRALGGGAARAARRRRAGQRPPARLRPRAIAARRAATRPSTGSPGCSTAACRSTGLAVDTDLRWALLSRAGRRRAASTTPRSTPSSTRDNTISGQERAAAARAVRPDGRGQGGRLGGRGRSATTSRTRPSAASPSAFQAPGQEEVLAPYVDTLPRGRPRRSGRTKGIHVPRRGAGVPLPAGAGRPGDPRPGRRLARTTAANPAAVRYVREGAARPRAGAGRAGAGRPTPEASRSARPSRLRRAACGGRRACSASCAMPRTMRADEVAGARTRTASRAQRQPRPRGRSRLAARLGAGDDLERARGRVDHHQHASGPARPAPRAAARRTAAVVALGRGRRTPRTRSGTPVSASRIALSISCRSAAVKPSPAGTGATRVGSVAPRPGLADGLVEAARAGPPNHSGSLRQPAPAR